MNVPCAMDSFSKQCNCIRGDPRQGMTGMDVTCPMRDKIIRVSTSTSEIGRQMLHLGARSIHAQNVVAKLAKY